MEASTPAWATQLLIGTYSERLPHVEGIAEGVLGCSYNGGTLGPPSLPGSVAEPVIPSDHARRRLPLLSQRDRRV